MIVNKLNEENSKEVYYHGSSLNFTQFKPSINWLTTCKDYAKIYATWSLPTGYIYTCKIKYNSLYDCGITDYGVFKFFTLKQFDFSPEFQKILDDLSITREESIELVKQVADKYDIELTNGFAPRRTYRIDVVTRSSEFEYYVKRKGYDGLHTLEGKKDIGKYCDCYAIYDNKNIEIISKEEIGMNINKINEKLETQSTLNPKLWNKDNTLKDEVRTKILDIVDKFTKDLEEDGIKFNLKDIVLVGSNASYNYTDKSDLDIHLIMDTKDLECPEDLYPKLYSAYRSIWNKDYDIDFYDIPVELFVEITDDLDENWYSNHKRWGNQRSRNQKREFAKAMSDIDEFCKENDIDQSSTSDSYYFYIGDQHYRVSNHSVESSPYHNGRDDDTIYIHASKLRIKDIYNNLKAGKKLDSRGNIIG